MILAVKGVLAVNLYLDAPRYKRKFTKLTSRIGAAGSEVGTSDFENFANMDPNELKSSYAGIILSGTEALYTRTADRARFSNFIQFLPKIQFPVLAICGGHQALALAYAGNVNRMKGLVQGFKIVNLEDKDTLLAGLPNKIRVMESHKEEVKTLPKNFVRIARSSQCKIEGMRHKDLPLYGVQFHPERWNEQNLAGKRILENFISLLG